jgi:hypothetical protein
MGRLVLVRFENPVGYRQDVTALRIYYDDLPYTDVAE